MRSHPNAELDAVIGRELLLRDALAINKRAQLAAWIYYKVLAVLADDLSMVARDARIGDLEIFAGLASDPERDGSKRQLTLLCTVDEEELRYGRAYCGAGDG